MSSAPAHGLEAAYRVGARDGSALLGELRSWVLLGEPTLLLIAPADFDAVAAFQALALELEGALRWVRFRDPDQSSGRLCAHALEELGEPEAPDPEAALAALATGSVEADLGIALLADAPTVRLSTLRRLVSLAQGSRGALRLAVVAAAPEDLTQGQLEALGPDCVSIQVADEAAAAGPPGSRAASLPRRAPGSAIGWGARRRQLLQAVGPAAAARLARRLRDAALLAPRQRAPAPDLETEVTGDPLEWTESPALRALPAPAPPRRGARSARSREASRPIAPAPPPASGPPASASPDAGRSGMQRVLRSGVGLLVALLAANLVVLLLRDVRFGEPVSAPPPLPAEPRADPIHAPEPDWRGGPGMRSLRRVFDGPRQLFDALDPPSAGARPAGASDATYRARDALIPVLMGLLVGLLSVVRLRPRRH